MRVEGGRELGRTRGGRFPCFAVKLFSGVPSLRYLPGLGPRLSYSWLVCTLAVFGILPFGCGIYVQQYYSDSCGIMILAIVDAYTCTGRNFHARG